MYGQKAQDLSIQIQYFVQWGIPLDNFSLKYFERKDEGYIGGDELLWKNLH